MNPIGASIGVLLLLFSFGAVAVATHRVKTGGENGAVMLLFTGLAFGISAWRLIEAASSDDEEPDR